MGIPVIDIFAGPGGLGEGFSSLIDAKGKSVFKIALSIEKDPVAHETLTLRSFFRQFDKDKVPDDYYEFVKGKISLSELYKKHPKQAELAKNEAWQAVLGRTANKKIDEKIKTALNGQKDWLLIGGPPCQAYSVVGRSRRQEKLLNAKTDHRVGLYKQYLRILAIHNPAVFVMENVKGILSAETKYSHLFAKIRKDLSNPVSAYKADYGSKGVSLACPGYQIYSLVVMPQKDVFGDPSYKDSDFIIHAEEYGIPQARHRVILLGIRNDIKKQPEILERLTEVSISKVITGLPRLRSGLSKAKDSNEAWKNVIKAFDFNHLLNGIDEEVTKRIIKVAEEISAPQNGVGKEYIPKNDLEIEYRPDWFLDKRVGGVCNHMSRGHMNSDLIRYLFVSCFAKIHHRSPKLEDFPEAILPKHGNVKEGVEDKKFADRFRVQLIDKPAKTITSHISKDGHYYIHPDSTQCRSFTVREAARIQTFPDNYFFCGPRTEQFRQVGNAVPPLLANQIAKIVFQIFGP